MIVKSSIRDYSVLFSDSNYIKNMINNYEFLIVDSKVYNLHSDLFSDIEKEKILTIEAIESNKDLSKCTDYIELLIKNGLKRGNTIAGIGGGVVQDIVGFISSIIYRGIDWYFFPTTLLAQCDSCIGGKTSINFKGYKNLIGNFNPPKGIFLCNKFLSTLEEEQIQSGLGEIIKIAFLDKQKRIKDYELINAINTCQVANSLIQRALLIKKEIIEIDEFDKGLRNIMNYGHTFGHAIETLTAYKIPHGIAVGLGIAIANKISNNSTIENIFPDSMSTYLKFNKKYTSILFLLYNNKKYIKILLMDKKNTTKDNVNCILPNESGDIVKKTIEKKYFEINLEEIVRGLYDNSI